MYGFDEYLIYLVFPTFLFSLYAQYKIKSTFKKYSQSFNNKSITGSEVARIILDRNRLNDVAINYADGSLTDNYNPKTKSVNLSSNVYDSNSLAALGVAAHETGHAIQDAKEYFPLKLRNTMVPLANIGSSAGPYIAIFGLMLSSNMLLWLGILLFSGAVAFYLITLPVEFNASKIAILKLEEYNILSNEELISVRKVLNAAALTYVASPAVAMAQLLRFILLSRRNDK